MNLEKEELEAKLVDKLLSLPLDKLRIIIPQIIEIAQTGKAPTSAARSSSVLSKE